MENYEAIKRILQTVQAEARSVNGAFNTLISKELTISLGNREVASKSHNDLREFLRNENGRDSSFPVILSNIDADFIGGSYGRETKIWPLDDIDIYVPIDGHGLVYYNQYGTLPFLVLSDDEIERNPINSDRWYLNGSISSAKLVTEFAKVLRRHYPETTDVKPNDQAVTIRMVQGETKHEDGLGYDIVPCFSLKSISGVGNEEFYLIPDGNNGWIRSNPRIDARIADNLNAYHQGTYKKVVRLIKYWNKIHLNNVIKSYYIELAVCNIFYEKQQERKVFSKISEGLAWGFYELNSVLNIGNQKSIINQAPSIEPGFGNDSETLLSKTSCKKASENANAAWKAEMNGNENEGINEWKKVFGDDFGK